MPQPRIGLPCHRRATDYRRCMGHELGHALGSNGRRRRQGVLPLAVVMVVGVVAVAAVVLVLVLVLALLLVEAASAAAARCPSRCWWSACCCGMPAEPAAHTPQPLQCTDHEGPVWSLHGSID